MRDKFWLFIVVGKAALMTTLGCFAPLLGLRIAVTPGEQQILKATMVFLVVFSLVAPFLPNLLVGVIAAVAVLAVRISDPYLSKRHERTPRAHAPQRQSPSRSKSR